MAEEEFGQPVTGAEEIDTDVFAASQQISSRFFLLGGNVNGGERPGAIQDGELPGIAPVVLMRSPGRRGINAGAMTSHGMPVAVSARCNSKPHGPAS